MTAKASRPDGSSPTAAPPHRESRAVRKTVTVVFADVVGSTAFAEQVDAESARDVMGRYHAMARDVVEAHGGTIAKFIGDGVMALFGVPEVAEDDAARAVACGVELQRRFAPMAERVNARYGAGLGLRVGINTGEVVIAADDADVVGDVLNTAARIEAACRPGRVLVGVSTWRLTRASIDYEALDQVTVKGKDEPVAIFEVVDAVTEADDASTPFVGRRDEQRILLAALDQAIAAQSAKLAMVIGSPGVGKTRLASELLRSVEDRATGVTLRCERAGTDAFAPIRDLLIEVASVEPDAHPDAKLSALDTWFDPDQPDRERLVDLLGSFIGAGSARSTEESFFAVRRMLEVLGATQPVVIVLDDLQWAEPLLVDLLEHLVEWVDGAAVLLLGLARPEIRSARTRLTEGGARVAAVVPLEGLDAEETHRLAAGLLGVEELPAELVTRLPASTEGNPLFVRELVRMLADDGVLVLDDGSYQLTVDVEAVEVPPTIQTLLATRVERLPDQERHLLERASVIGSDFALGALAALVPGHGRDTITSLLEGLRRRELLDSTSTYAGDEPVFRFHHVLIRDAAYRRLLKGVRADLHLQVADWTDEALASSAAEHDIGVAFHLEQAHRYRRELGDVDDETDRIGARASGMLRSAASQALLRDDLASAGSMARRALGLVGPDHRSRPELLLLACEALVDSGDIVAGREMVAELRAAGDRGRLAAWAECFDAQLIVLAEPQILSSAVERSGQAADRLSELGDEAGVAKARQVRAAALARLGQIAECEEELDRALNAARAAEDGRRITAVLGAAPLAALWGPSPVSRAGGRCLDVVRLLRITTGSPAVEATSVRCQAVLEALRGRFESARDLLAKARGTATELGLRHSLLETQLYAGFVEILADDGEAAESYLREAHAGFDSLGVGADAGQAAAYLGRALLAQGRFSEAEMLADEAERVAGQNLQTIITAGSVRGELLSERGLHDEAVAVVGQAVATASRTDLSIELAEAKAALARVLANAGATGEAEATRQEAVRLFRAKGAVHGLQPEDGRNAVVDPSRLSARNNSRLERLRTQLRDAPDDGWNMTLAVDFVREDRRRGGVSLGTSDRRGFAEDANAARAIGARPGEDMYQVVGEQGDVLLVRTGIDYGDDRVSPVLLAIRWNADDLVDRIVAFDGTDVESARSTVTDLARRPETEPGGTSGPDRPIGVEAERGSGALTNQAARTTELGVALLNDDEWGGFDRLIAPEMLREDRRSGLRVATDRDGFLRGARALRDLGGTQQRIRHLALRGEHLALSALDVSYEDRGRVPFLLINQLNQGGQVARNMLFEPADLVEAVAELDRLYAAESAPRHIVESLTSYFAALNRDDRDAMAELVDVSAVIVDHRPASLGVLSGREYRELVERLHEEHHGALSNIITRIDRATDDHALIGLDRYQPSDELGAPTWRLHAVVWIHGERMVRAELFAEEEVDRARATFESWRAWEADRPDNQATKVMAELISRIRPDDLLVYDELVAEDVVREDHRPGVADNVMVGREAMLHMASTMHDMGLRVLPFQPLAMRGGHLTLGFSGYQSPGGDQLPILGVCRTDDRGQVDRLLFFDPDDLSGAMATLHRMWEPELTTRESADARRAEQLLVAVVDGDAAHLVELVGPTFLEQDHRTGGEGARSSQPRKPGDGAGQPAPDRSGSIASRFHRVANGVVAFDYLVTSRATSGFTTDRSGVAVLLTVGGRILERHDFATDQLPAALQLADRLDKSEPPPSRPPRNLATITWAERIDAAARARDWNAVDALFSDDLEFEMHRRTATTPDGGKEELIAARGSFQAVGMEVGYQTLEVCGERLALIEATVSDGEGNEVVAEAVVEVDDDGLTTYYGVWDPDDIAEARVVLRARGVRSGATDSFEHNAAVRALGTLAEYLSSGDFTALDRSVDPAVRLLDHRSGISQEHVGRGAIGGGLRSTSETLRHEGFQRVAGRGDHLAIGHGDWLSQTGDLEPALAVVRTDANRRIDRIVLFDPDALLEAAAELDRQFVDVLEEGPATALGVLLGSLAAVNAGPDAAAFASFLSDDYATVDHRAASLGTIDGAEQLRQLEVLSELQPGLRSVISSIYRLDDRRLVFTFDRFPADDLASGPNWRVHHVGSVVGGRFQRLDLFPEDALDEALARYEQLHRGDG